MNVIVNEDNVIAVGSEVYHSHNGEDGAVQGIAYFLVLETDSGERLRHNHVFKSLERETFRDGDDMEYECYVQTDAAERAERLASRVTAAGTINTENWSYMEPRYGSAAYVDQWCEAQQVAREKMAA